ncbi:MAG: hypothetical protein AAF481_04760 [Acidobacteriota bacterium]
MPGKSTAPTKARPDQSTEPGLANAFHPAFLEWLNAFDLPSTSGEAGSRGPWKVEMDQPAGRFAVLRQAESLAGGDEARFLLYHRQDALLAAAALPALGIRDTYSLGGRAVASADPALAGTFPLLREGELAGHCRNFEGELLGHLHAFRALCTHPDALAHLLEAAGHEAVLRAGRILARQVAGRRI